MKFLQKQVNKPTVISIISLELAIFLVAFFYRHLSRNEHRLDNKRGHIRC